MMKVLQVITKAEHGGAQTQVRLLLEGLSAQQHEVELCVGSTGALCDIADALGITQHHIPGLGSSRPLQLASQIGAVADLIRRSAPDVVHCHSSHAGLVTRLASRRAGATCVYTAHGFQFKRTVPLARRVAAFAGEFVAARAGGRIICVNRVEVRLARRWLWVPLSRIAMIPTSAPAAPPAPASNPVGRQSQGAPLKIVFVGRLAAPKRQDLAIAAVAMMESPVELLLVGDGPDRERLTASVRDGRSAVRLLGDRSDVAALIADADVLTLISEHEGAPVALVEAMRAGRCIVASDLPGIREQLDTAGVLVSNRAESIAAAWQSLALDDALRHSLGEAGRRRYEERFTPERVVEATLEVYEQAVTDSLVSRRR